MKNKKFYSQTEKTNQKLPWRTATSNEWTEYYKQCGRPQDETIKGNVQRIGQPTRNKQQALRFQC